MKSYFLYDYSDKYAGISVPLDMTTILEDWFTPVIIYGDIIRLDSPNKDLTHMRLTHDSIGRFFYVPEKVVDYTDSKGVIHRDVPLYEIQDIECVVDGVLEGSINDNYVHKDYYVDTYGEEAIHKDANCIAMIISKDHIFNPVMVTSKIANEMDRNMINATRIHEIVCDNNFLHIASNLCFKEATVKQKNYLKYICKHDDYDFDKVSKCRALKRYINYQTSYNRKSAKSILKGFETILNSYGYSIYK